MDDLRVQNECRLKLLGIEQETANILAGHANEVKHREPTITERSAVLYGAISKLQESSKAIRLLGDHGFPDEMNVLLRTQVELTVNACYLQHATDEEIKGYLHHDPIAGYVALQDMARAHKGSLRVPIDLERRVTKLANDASSESGLDLTSRQWDKKNIKKKADTVDAQTGLTDFTGMLATVYVMGSGYVHGSYKTIHKHIRYLAASEEDYPWHTMFAVNNALHGVGYVQLTFARYIAKRFDLPYTRLNELSRDGSFICDVMNKDYALHKKSKGGARFKK